MMELLKAIVEMLTALIRRGERRDKYDDLYKMPKVDEEDPTVFIRKDKK